MSDPVVETCPDSAADAVRKLQSAPAFQSQGKRVVRHRLRKEGPVGRGQDRGRLEGDEDRPKGESKTGEQDRQGDKTDEPRARLTSTSSARLEHAERPPAQPRHRLCGSA